MNVDRNKVLVTGASGWIGRQVCRHLQERGCAVVAFGLPTAAGIGSEAFFGRLECFEQPSVALRELLGKTLAVVHCAGRAHRPIETPTEVALFEQTNVEGTRALLSACRRAGVQRAVYLSTIAGYDWNVPVADECGMLAPATAYARTKLAGERLVRESGLDWRVVRLATVFGSGDKANFATLARALRRRRFVIPGEGTVRKSVIPVELAAEVLARLVLLDEPRHRLLNAALSESPTLRQICDSFAVECGFPKAPSVPLGVLRMAGRLGDLVARPYPSFPMTSTKLHKLTTSTVVKTVRLRETLPDLPDPTFADAVRAAAEFYRTA